MSGDLKNRVYRHKHKLLPGFTSRYNIDLLVYAECYDDPVSAIRREKQIKGMSRAKKMELISSVNPKWEDLSESWFDETSHGESPS